MNKFIFTCGDINGVGPEVTLKTLLKFSKLKDSQFIFICPSNVLEEVKKLTNSGLRFTSLKNPDYLDGVKSKFIHIDIGNFRLSKGKPTLSSGRASVKSLEEGVKLVKSLKSSVLITSPISKTSISLAGFKYPGHTEYLAEQSDTDTYSMMFLSNKMKCSLVTIHEPICRVPELLTKQRILNQILVVQDSLKYDFGIIEPKIAVLGFNPHAGEGGRIGSEEENEIKPAIKIAGRHIYGPFVPDAFFAKQLFKEFDCVVGMYHDQVLIPFKMLDFNKGVNYTAGLSFIRTSPDHGTAYDIAWKNIADPGSTINAFRYARQILNNR